MLRKHHFGVFLKSLSLEQSELNCIIVDMDSQDDEKTQVTLLVQELATQTGEDQIVYRNKKRYISRLIHNQIERTQDFVIDPDGYYFITGGLSGLGLHAAKWFAEHGAKHLLLMGRSPAKEEAQAVIDELTEQGVSVYVEQGDVTHQLDLAKLFNKMKTNEIPLRGVLHAAGVLNDGFIRNLSWADFEKVLSPKVLGAWNLHELTKDQPLDYFILFSSIASVLGSPGQANYSAGNSFLDSLAIYRVQQGLPAISINWGPWADVGMWQRTIETETAIQTGLLSINVDKGFQALALALSSGQAQLTIAPIQWETIFSSLGLYHESRFLQHMIAELPKEKQPTAIALDLSGLSERDRKAKLKAFVTKHVKETLGMKEDSSISEETGFFDMGMDSLIAVDLKNRLQVGIGRTANISTSVVYDHHSIEKLTQHLSEILKIEGIQYKQKTPISRELTISDIMLSKDWVREYPSKKKARFRFFCFHHAGGGQSVYKPWCRLLPDDVSLCTIQLPAREERKNETVGLTRHQIIHSIIQSMIPNLDLPFAMVGHSFGVLVCYDVVIALNKLSLPSPVQLFFSSYEPDRVGKFTQDEKEQFLQSSDEELVHKMDVDYLIIPETVKNDPSALKMFITALRYDLKYEVNHPQLKEPLNVRINTVCGDDEMYDKRKMLNWEKFTNKKIDHYTLNGGHFAVFENIQLYIKLILKALNKYPE